MSIRLTTDNSQTDDEIDFMQVAMKIKQAFLDSPCAATGVINVNDLRNMVHELNLHIPEDILEEAIMVGDVNEDGENIDFFEFLSGIIADLEDEDDDGDLKRAFSLFEENSVVSINDVSNVLKATGRTLTADQVNILLENYETATPNCVTFDEFKEIYNAVDDLL